MTKKKMTSKSKLIWALILIGFAIMEFPGIFFINRLDPMIFGLPFIYGFTIIMWAYMVAVMFYAYKTNWGKGNKNNDVEGGEK